MSKISFKPMLAGSIFAAIYCAGVTSNVNAMVTEVVDDSSNTSIEANLMGRNSILPPVNEFGQRRYIIKMNSPSVSMFDGNTSFSPIPKKSNGKLDVHSAAAHDYQSHLIDQQTQALNELSNALGRSVSAYDTFQFAFNGMAIYLEDSEVPAASSVNGIQRVSLDRDYFVTTDAGPALIGANNIWGVDGVPSSDLIFENGFEMNAPAGNFGAGIVIGTLDTGINFDHPSFATVGGDGYTHINPLGSGNYLGACDSGNTDQYMAEYTCNDKLIGGYDFVNGLEPVDGFDIPGPEDENGHGSHTASTSGGNMLGDVEFSGVTGIQMSGVAPHATVVAFDVCYNTADGRGSCPGVSSIASVEQAISDGLVDVINFSIGGGNDPWLDSVSEAFLNATASGILVATSAGNSGPDAGTLGHVEPWTISSGASTHARVFESTLSLTAPVSDPVVQNILYTPGSGPAVTAMVTTGITYAGDVDAANIEGCVAFPASSFDGGVALISRGACAFADKVNNAEAAGAVAVIVHNNAAGGISMGGLEGTNIPAVSILQADGLNMVTYIQANTGSIVEINSPVRVMTGQADVMAGFSSRGPSPYEYTKPDVTAPGVDILAAYDDDDTSVGTEAEYNAISGTSMSSPHTAGAAALLMDVNPGWSVPEVKSALMMTAKTSNVFKEDGVTPSDAFDRGAGRIQVDIASQTGLVMDETPSNYSFADPANGGDPKTLNVPSITDYRCIETCSFTRVFRSVADSTVTYDASVVGMPAVVTPASFTLNPGQFISLNVEVDGEAIPIGEYTFGELLIEEQIPATAMPFSMANSIDITDGGYTVGDGNGAMSCENVEVSGITSSSLIGSIELGASHTWIGDVTVKLINPDGDSLALFARPAFPASNFGSSADLDGASPVTFLDGGANDPEVMGAGGGVVCAGDSLCEYFANPDEEVTSVADFAAILSGTVNGTWQICGGDSFDDGGGIGGTIDSATFTVSELAEPAAVNLHLPMVVVGFPPAPEIDVNPTSLAQSQETDESNNQVLNIANTLDGGAPLAWNIVNDLSLVNYNIINQPTATLDGIVSDLFTNTNEGAYSADAMVLATNSSIEKMFFDGFVSTGDALSNNVSEMTLTIYSDAAGIPSNNPEDGLNGQVYTITLPLGDANLDTTGDAGMVEFDILGNDGNALDLAAGTYWVTAYATVTGANRWNWFAGVDSNPQNAMLIAPNTLFGGVPDWTDITVLTGNPIYTGLSYTATRELACGAPWLSTDLASGGDVPGASTDVTVTFDSTGLAEGNYAAAICITSNDLDEAQVIIPVTLTVQPAP